MFGRDAERAQIEQLLDSAADGPVGLALEGTPGIGKTTLWRAAVASARRRGYRVLEAAPGEPDSALAFAGLGDLFDGRDRRGRGRSARPAEARPVGGPVARRGARRHRRTRRRCHGLYCGVLRGLATSAPVVVAIDDDQWLDGRPHACSSLPCPGARGTGVRASDPPARERPGAVAGARRRVWHQWPRGVDGRPA